MATNAALASNPESPILAAQGGSFLVEDRTPDEIFTPEDLTEEQRMIGQTCADWMEKDVIPKLPEILKELILLEAELDPGHRVVR